MNIPHWLQSDIDVTLLSAFKIPARSRFFFEISDRADFEKMVPIYEFAQENHLPVVIIGGGTNCLFAFDIFDGIIIHNHYMGWEEPTLVGSRQSLWVHSGESSHNIAMRLYDVFGISTLVPWVGLPGTFGGATIGNAGCFGVEMADICTAVDLLDTHTGAVERWTYDKMQYGYRTSILKGQSRYMVIATCIDISPLGGEYESYTPTNLRSIRKLKQPIGISCGSFFQNPKPPFDGGAVPMKGMLLKYLSKKGEVSLSAGRLIDDAGLKGTRIGGVKISEQHGNFFINDQKGSWKDVIELQEYIQEYIDTMYGIHLEPEVRIITNSF